MEGSTGIYDYSTSVYLECVSKTTEWAQSNQLHGPNLGREPLEYKLTVLGQLAWCETPKSVIGRVLSVLGRFTFSMACKFSIGTYGNG